MTSKCLQALLACSLLLCHHGADTVAAVSPQGSAGPIQLWAAPAEGQQQEHDERDGTQPSQPVRGLGRARDAVRTALATPEGRSRGVTITLRAGTYDDGPLRLGAADSGRLGAEVTWRGEPGSLLSGGVKIPTSAWSLAPPAPTRPTGVGAAVWQANLTALGLSEAALGVVGQGSVLDGRGHASAFAELFYAGAAATLARWPNKAADGSTVYAYTLGGVCGGPKVRGGCEGGCELGCNGSLAAQCSSGCTGIVWRSARLSEVGAPPAAAHDWAAAPALGAPLLHGFWTHEWRDLYVPITAVNTTSNTIFASDPAHVAFNDGSRNIKRGNSRWYALNIRAELDQQGEYYIHRNATNRESSHGMVYFIPPPQHVTNGSLHSTTGAPPTLPAFVSANASVLEFEPGAANLRFEGLQIAYSQRTTIVGERVSNITVVNCSIFGAGGGGANLTGSGIRLLSNEISGIGGTALLIDGGNNVTLEKSNNLVHGNQLHNFARWFRTYHPGVAVAGVGNTISANHIHSCPHAAVLLGPPRADRAAVLNTYTGNLIENAVQEGEDAGAFYGVGDQFSLVNLGNVVRNNTFRHIRPRYRLHLDGPKSPALYFDNGLSSYLVENNRWEDCQIGVLINGGIGHTFKNNSFSRVDHIVWGGCGACANSSSLARPAGWTEQYAMLQKVSRLSSWRSTFPASLLAPSNKSLEWWSHTTCEATPTGNVFGVDNLSCDANETNCRPAAQDKEHCAAKGASCLC
jgi:hypothetical protein